MGINERRIVMKVKIFNKIYEVETVVYCEEEKGNYYYLKGKKIPYCDLDYDIEIINDSWEEVKSYLKYVLYGQPGTRAICYNSTSGYLEPFIDDVEKKLKAFEIIKEKRVDVTFFDTYVKWNWEKYLNRKLKCSEKELTKDEFDLLKEVL